MSKTKILVVGDNQTYNMLKDIPDLNVTYIDQSLYSVGLDYDLVITEDLSNIGVVCKPATKLDTKHSKPFYQKGRW